MGGFIKRFNDIDRESVITQLPILQFPLSLGRIVNIPEHLRQKFLGS